MIKMRVTVPRRIKKHIHPPSEENTETFFSSPSKEEHKESCDDSHTYFNFWSLPGSLIRIGCNERKTRTRGAKIKGQLTYSTERTSSPETESDFDSPAKEYHNDDENVSTGIFSSTAKRLIINHVTFPTERSDNSAYILYSHNIYNFKSNIINHSKLGCYNYIFNSCSHNVIGKCLNICFSSF